MVLTASAAAACFPQAEIGSMGNNDARQGSSAGFHRFPPQPHAPGKKEKPPPRAKNTLSAPDSRKKQLPRAEKALSAPGSREKQLPRAEKALSAPGSRKKLLLRAEKALSAPGSGKKQLPRAEKSLSAPDGREKQFERSEAPSGACREKGEGRREERCDDRKAPGAKAFGGRRPTEGGRQSRAGESFPPSPGGAGGINGDRAKRGPLTYRETPAKMLALMR